MRTTTRTEALHLIAMADPNSSPVLFCQRCDLAIVVRPGVPVQCTCGAVPCADCAVLLANHASRLP